MQTQRQLRFSVVVPTFNRPALLALTLESLRWQTYGNFHVVVLDDGSQPPVAPIVQQLNDSRFEVVRYEENLHPADILEDSLALATGDVFICVEDDNGLMPTALEAVSQQWAERPEIEWLGTNFLGYNHVSQSGAAAESIAFSGAHSVRSAREWLWDFCSVWGIGPIRPAPLPAHFSATYLSTSLLRRAKERFGRVFVKPLGDVSLLALTGLLDEIHYLDLPLSYIGEHEGQITKAGQSGGRSRLKNSVWLRGYSVRHSPIRRGLSYDNLAVDCHLDVCYRLGLIEHEFARLRPDFFRRHLRAVMSDSPWTRETLMDLREVLPHLMAFQPVLESAVRTCRRGMRLVRNPWRTVQNRSKRQSPGASCAARRQFRDCLEFARWAGTQFMGQRSPDA